MSWLRLPEDFWTTFLSGTKQRWHYIGVAMRRYDSENLTKNKKSKLKKQISYCMIEKENELRKGAAW